MKMRAIVGTGLALLIGAVAFAAPANAAGPTPWFKSLAALSWCAQENGTSTPVYLDPCSTTSTSNFWTTVSTALQIEEIVNEHSHLCLTGESDGVTVDLKKCTNSDAQKWSFASCTIGDFMYVNVASGGFLWQSNKSLQTRSVGDVKSSHDCWGFYAAA